MKSSDETGRKSSGNPQPNPLGSWGGGRGALSGSAEVQPDRPPMALTGTWGASPPLGQPELETRRRPVLERFSRNRELSKLYRERRELLELDRRGSIDPAWVRRRLRLVTRSIDARLLEGRRNSTERSPVVLPGVRVTRYPGHVPGGDEGAGGKPPRGRVAAGRPASGRPSFREGK